MNVSYVLELAAQDQRWSQLDDWYRSKTDRLAIHGLVDFLDREPNGRLFDQIRKLDNASLDILRRLALHTFRELALREVGHKEGTQEGQE